MKLILLFENSGIQMFYNTNPSSCTYVEFIERKNNNNSINQLFVSMHYYTQFFFTA